MCFTGLTPLSHVIRSTKVFCKSLSPKNPILSKEVETNLRLVDDAFCTKGCQKFVNCDVQEVLCIFVWNPSNFVTSDKIFIFNPVWKILSGKKGSWVLVPFYSFSVIDFWQIYGYTHIYVITLYSTKGIMVCVCTKIKYRKGSNWYCCRLHVIHNS